MLQKTVNQKLAYGVPGDLFDTFPRAIDPKIVAGGAICRFYTVDTTDPRKAVLGGTGVLAGIAVNTKEYIINGLTPSVTFRSGDVAQLMTMGRVYMQLDTEVQVGMAAYYSIADGSIKAAAPSTSMEGYVKIPNSMFVEVNALAGEISVLELR